MPRPNKDKTAARDASVEKTDGKLDAMGGKDIKGAVDAAEDVTDLSLVAHRVDVDSDPAK